MLSYQREAFGLFQSTHPRGVRLIDLIDIIWPMNISIHAPTWGATITDHCHGHKQEISIHAPTWGATQKGDKLRRGFQFQSTHPRGVRLMFWSSSLPHFEISIHAPTWGATFGKMGSKGLFANFNPRTHVGCDRNCDISHNGFPNFNPRTHVGCDLSIILALSPNQRFQSTHPRGVRPGGFIWKYVDK